jgi:dipeptidyl-peptidase-4
MRIIRIITCLLLLIMLVPALQAQKKRYDSIKDAIFSAGQLSGEDGPSNLTWIENGERYSFTKYQNSNQEIWIYDPKSDKKELIFSSGDFTFPETDQPFRYLSFQWTKDYKYILFQANFKPIWRYSGNADYFYYSISNKTLEPIVKAAFTAEVSPDGSKVGYGKDGNLFVFDFDTKEHVQLTDDAEDFFYNGRFGWAYEEEFGLVQAWSWSPDNRFIAFWQSDERDVPVYKLTDFSDLHPEYMEIPYPKVGDSIPEVKIGILNISQQKKFWLDIDLKDGYIPRIYWTSRNNILAVIHMNRKQNHLKLYFYNVESGDKKLVLEEQSESWIDIFDFFAGRLNHFYFPEDMEEFFWISERDGWAHIYRYDYEGKLLNQVTSGEWEVIGIETIDSKKSKLYYVSTEESPLERRLFSIGFNGSGKKQLTLATGNHSVNVSPNGKYYLDSYSDIDTPRQVELRTTGGKMLKKLVDSKDVLEYLEEQVYTPKELFSFETSDGQTLEGYIIKPVDFDKGKIYPLLLDIYGGPGSQSVFNSFSTNTWHQYLAQEGYVIADVNNRGNGGYGSQFEKIVYGKLGEWESNDFIETAKFLSSKTWIDSSRMAIRGHSYGGYMSGYTMLRHPGVFKVAIVAAPVTDHRFYDCIYTERYMGLIDENQEGYEKSAVLTYAGNLDGHLFLAHSLMDENVHPQNTFQLVIALIDNGKDFDLKIYPPGAHGVAYDMNSYLLLMEQYTKYLDMYLKEE